MYILAVLGVILSVLLMTIAGEDGLAGVATLFYTFDIISILIILIIAIPVVISTGLHKDFNNAFKFAIGKKKAKSLLELKRAKEAIILTGRTVMASGILGACFSWIIIAYKVEAELEHIMPNLGVSFITILYALIVYLLLLPIRSKLEIKIIEFMQE